MPKQIFLFCFLSFLYQKSSAQPYLDFSEPIIDKEVFIESSLEDVWEAWTTKEGLKGFLAPESHIEFFPGGLYELYFQPHAQEGSKGSEGSSVLSFIPKEMFSFSWTPPVHFPKLRDHGEMTWVVLNFEKLDGKRIKVRLRQLGWKEGKEWINLFNYYDETWDAVLGWLKTYLEG